MKTKQLKKDLDVAYELIDSLTDDIDELEDVLAVTNYELDQMKQVITVLQLDIATLRVRPEPQPNWEETNLPSSPYRYWLC